MMRSFILMTMGWFMACVAVGMALDTRTWADDAKKSVWDAGQDDYHKDMDKLRANLLEIRKITKELQDYDSGTAKSPNFSALGPTQSNFLVERLTKKADALRAKYGAPEGNPFIMLNVRLSTVNRISIILGEADEDGATHWLWVRGVTEKDLFDGLERGLETIFKNVPVYFQAEPAPAPPAPPAVSVTTPRISVKISQCPPGGCHITVRRWLLPRVIRR